MCIAPQGTKHKNKIRLKYHFWLFWGWGRSRGAILSLLLAIGHQSAEQTYKQTYKHTNADTANLRFHIPRPLTVSAPSAR